MTAGSVALRFVFHVVMAVTAMGFVGAVRGGETFSILVVEQEDIVRPSYVEFMSGFQRGLATNLPGPAIIHAEYLGLARYGRPGYEEGLEAWFRTKYRGEKLDVVVALGNSSLNLLCKLRSELRLKVPIVFSNIEVKEAKKMTALTNVTGVALDPDLPAALNAVLQLCPDTRRIVYVGGGASATRVSAFAQREVERFAGDRYEFIALTNLALPEIKQRLATLPPQTIVFYFALWADRTGQRFVPRDVLVELSEVSSAPIFSSFETFLGHGTVGGYCINYTSLGHEVADQVAAVLRAGAAGVVPVKVSAGNRMLWDWRQLKRFQLDPQRLPAGSEVRYRPPGLWKAHRNKVIFAGSALLLQSALIAGLLFQRKRRRRAESSLTESEERMDLAVEAANLGLWAWQADSDGVWMTPRCRRLCGYGSESGFGRSSACAQPDGTECSMLVLAMAQVKPDSPDFEFETLQGRDDGQPRWIVSRGRGFFDKSNRLRRLIGVSLDVTERKRISTELQEQREQLAHVGRVSVMGQLASSLAHEISQPLGAILRNAEAAELFLQDKAPNLDEVRSIIADIRKDNQRAGEVIDRMRGLLKRRNLESHPVEVRALVDEIVSLIHSDAGSRQVTVTNEVPALLPTIQGDRIHLQQVLLNLLLNGMDAMNGLPDREIVVSALALDERTVEVAVSDTGPGIPADKLPRLFEPFFTTKGQGMGMGLPLSRTIIEAHGGRIWAENRAGGGATFRFTLPIFGKGRLE